MHQRIAGAIDIGGTNIRVSLVSRQGKVLTGISMPTLTGEGSAPACVQKMYEALVSQCADIRVDLRRLAGIGVVCAGPIDCQSGVIDNPYTLPGWEGFNIVEHLSSLTGLPVKLEHDVNGALLGEVFLNQWQGKRVLMISFGTGIGVAVYDRDHSFRAGARYHPEMGHIVVDSYAENACYCRHGGCFESLWSGSALAKTAQQHGHDSFDTMFEKWRKGDKALEDEMNRLQAFFRNGVWNLMLIFKPDVLVLGGGLMQTYYPFCSELIKDDLMGLEDFVETFEVLPARHGDGSAVVGASRLIFPLQKQLAGKKEPVGREQDAGEGLTYSL